MAGKKPKSYKIRHIPRSHKTTTRQGYNEYMRQYMAMRREEQRQALRKMEQALCHTNLQDALGLDFKKLRRVQRPRK